MARRLRLTVSYDGSDFSGWQVQPGFSTIQGTLEEILTQIEGRRVSVAGSGRTDAGVHALAQVAACSLDNPIPTDNLRKAMNRLLPASIRILDVAEVDALFHPRFQAVAKTYEYRIWREEVCPPFDWRYVYHRPYPLDEAAFRAAALIYEGSHDFTAFSSADEKDGRGTSKVRTIFSSTAERRGPILFYRVRGSGFLKHMVRNLVGGLLEVGKGNLVPEDLAAHLQSARRLGYSVPARGLFLVNVEYPA
jgi:tRNA pseudouridine38-40 synthase